MVVFLRVFMVYVHSDIVTGNAKYNISCYIILKICHMESYDMNVIIITAVDTLRPDGSSISSNPCAVTIIK